MSAPEVTHVSRHGFWRLPGDEELRVRFDDVPWFRQATIGALTGVERPSVDHLDWPQPVVDLSVRAIRRPAESRLVSKAPADDASTTRGGIARPPARRSRS
jgi:hypothetical protein